MGSAWRFLTATDFSDDAHHAVFRAALLAKEHQARLELLHVVTESSVQSLQSFVGMPADIGARLVNEAGSALADLAEDISRCSGVETIPRVVLGDPADAIADAAESSRLVVLGAHGTGGLRNLFMGTVADRVLRRSKKPVLVVKQAPEEPYRSVLVPVAFGPHSASALQAALLFAPDAAVTALNVFAVPYEPSLHLAGLRQDQIEAYRETARAAASAGLDELIAGSGVGVMRVRRVLENGDASTVILEKAAGLKSDLIVIGKRGRTALEDLLLGSVTRHVLSGAPVDVLIVGGNAGDGTDPSS